MFETHKQNLAFANSPCCNLTPVEWMCLSVTSLSDRSEGRLKKKQKNHGSVQFPAFWQNARRHRAVFHHQTLRGVAGKMKQAQVC